MHELQIYAPAPMEPEPEYVSCHLCDGPGSLLGVLGTREHFRCRNCGMDFSRAVRASEDLVVDFCV